MPDTGYSYTKFVFPPGKRRSERWRRTLSAFWLSGKLRLAPLRRPLLVLTVALIICTVLYSELSVFAGYERLPFYDTAYIVLALMVLESATALPPEWYLVLFWFLMPLIGVYVFGSGVANLILFNRKSDRDFWEEAVASTYRDHVVVLGLGHLGVRVTRALLGMGMEVVVIDFDVPPDLDAEMSRVHVPVIMRDGCQQETLEQAQLHRARAFVICVPDNQVSLEATVQARAMKPDIPIVVRGWNMFDKDLFHLMGVAGVYSVSELAAWPVVGSAVGVQITQAITVRGTEYGMIGLEIESGSFLEGTETDTLEEMFNVDVVMRERDGQAEILPNGIMCGGDWIVVFADQDTIVHIIEKNIKSMNTNRNGSHIVVYGLGLLGMLITEILEQMGFEIRFVDPQIMTEVAERVRPDLPGVRREDMLLLPEVLENADLASARALIICTSDNLQNLEVAKIARDINPDLHIVVRTWEQRYLRELYGKMGIEAVYSASLLAAPAFAGAALGLQITQTLTIEGEDYSMIRLIVEEESFMDGVQIGVLQSSNKLDIMLHGHSEGVKVHPERDSYVRAGDTLVIFSEHSRVVEISQRNQRGGNGAGLHSA